MSDEKPPIPIPMILWCPMCHERHVDRGQFRSKPHHTHACQRCGSCWRPAIVETMGVKFLPGFKDRATGHESHCSCVDCEAEDSST